MQALCRVMEVSNPAKAFEILRSKVNSDAEELWVMGFNSQMQLVCHEMVFRGTANFCPFHPRDIFRILILNNACSFLIWHNHPSSSCLPSAEDLQLTKRLDRLAKMMEIPLLDHLITTSLCYISLADLGILRRKKQRQNY